MKHRDLRKGQLKIHSTHLFDEGAKLLLFDLLQAGLQLLDGHVQPSHLGCLTVTIFHVLHVPEKNKYLFLLPVTRMSKILLPERSFFFFGKKNLTGRGGGGCASKCLLYT